jgi:ADP-heptose:LPS heptosyltransferase
MDSSWKNRFLVLLKQPQPDRSRPIRRILIVSTTALGDTLWATPAIESLRAHFPGAYLSLLTSPIGKQVLKHSPHIDSFHVLKEPLLVRFVSLMLKLRRERFDAALIFHASQRLALPLCALSGIPRIVGTTGINKGLDDLLTDKLEPRFEHEIARRLSIAAAIGAPPVTDRLSYYVQPDEREAARAYLGSSQKKRIAIHPGSKEAFRRWPIRCFVQVAQALQERFGCEIFLTGTPSEKPLLLDFHKQWPAARIVESPSVRSLSAILEQMDLVLSNDTGPLHLACALHRPAVGLYVSTDPHLCGPFHAPEAVAIARSPTCRPCIKRRCQDPFCFLQISPQIVIETCTKILNNTL